MPASKSGYKWYKPKNVGKNKIGYWPEKLKSSALKKKN
jgi:hypothetical protein